MKVESPFFNFLEGLSNPEKSRNFSNQNPYKLDHFLSTWNLIYKKYSIQHNPIRIGIVGTNGKGSLAYYLGELCRIHSLSYGVYTSPHFFTPNERISINGIPIDTKILDSIYNSFNENEMEYIRRLSYFEVMTLFAGIAFSISKVDIEIIEAGLGGRLDATKAFASSTIALTKIGLDHMEVLGNSEEKIIIEKLGITTANTKKIFALEPTGQNREILISHLVNHSEANHIQWKIIPEFEPSDTDYLSIYKRMSYSIMKELLPEKIQLEKDKIPWKSNPMGRMEILKLTPLVVYDTAHNPQAVRNVLNDITRKYLNHKWTILIGSLPDKDQLGILESIYVYSDSIQKLIILNFDPFRSSISANKETMNEIHSSIPIQVIQSDHELNDSLISIKENKANLLAMGSFRIYPLLRRFFNTE